jgi:hypothetical protein
LAHYSRTACRCSCRHHCPLLQQWQDTKSSCIL